MRDVLILAPESSKEIGKSIYLRLKSKVKKRKVYFEVIEVSKFKSGELNLEIQESVKDKKVYIVQDCFSNEKFSIDDNLMIAYLMGQSAKVHGAFEINFVLPMFPYSRQDKIFSTKQEPVSFNLVISLLETLNPKRVITIDIHNPNTFIGSNKSFLVNIDIKDVIYEKLIKGKKIILSPTDFNGTKGVIEIAKKYKLPYLMVGKYRDHTKKNLVEEQFVFGEVKGKDILVVDDMIDTGGTMLNLVSILKDKGARSISIYSTHGLFSYSSVFKFLELLKSGRIENLYIGNTLERNIKYFENYDIKKVDVLSKIAEYVQNEIQ